MQKCADLVDLEKFCEMRIYLQKSASILPSTSLPKSLENRGSKIPVSGGIHSPPLAAHSPIFGGMPVEIRRLVFYNNLVLASGGGWRIETTLRRSSSMIIM